MEGFEMTTEKKVSAQGGNRVTDFSLGVFGSSNNFVMATNMANTLAASTIIPKEYQGNAANCMIAIEQAVRLKVSPMMVMQNLFVIQGRPSWSSKFLIAAINGSGKFDMELQFEETRDAKGKPFSCLAWTMKDGRRIDGMVVDMDMASAEGWLTKNCSKWKTMPQLMLRYRAASFFSSLNCPELTLGLYTKEEAMDSDLNEYSFADISETAGMIGASDNDAGVVDAFATKQNEQKEIEADGQQELNIYGDADEVK